MSAQPQITDTVKQPASKISPSLITIPRREMTRADLDFFSQYQATFAEEIFDFDDTTEESQAKVSLPLLQSVESIQEFSHPAVLAMNTVEEEGVSQVMPVYSNTQMIPSTLLSQTAKEGTHISLSSLKDVALDTTILFGIITSIPTFDQVRLKRGVQSGKVIDVQSLFIGDETLKYFPVSLWRRQENLDFGDLVFITSTS